MLSTYGERFGLDRETAFRVAGAFGGGMGMAETCGAVTGAFMVLGLKHGKIRGNDDASREKTDALVQALVTRFKAANRTILCRELLGCDIGTSEGLKTAKKEKLFKTLCPEFVREAAVILEDLLKPADAQT